jgi:prevent-host-death family protein
MGRARTHKTGPTSVGVRELKAHAARILREVRESRASYVVTHRGKAIGLILPVGGEDDPALASEPADASAAWHAFLRAGRRLEQRFTRGSSALGELSDMRR